MFWQTRKVTAAAQAASGRESHAKAQSRKVAILSSLRLRGFAALRQALILQLLICVMQFFSCTLALAQQPKAASGPKQPSPKQITNSIGMKLTLVPSGEFMMGSEEPAKRTAAFFNMYFGGHFYTADDFNDEHPRHRVRITRAFYLGAYHVTRGQFLQFVADTHYKTDAEKGEMPGAFSYDPEEIDNVWNAKISWRSPGFEQTDEHPVVCVSWNDAAAFCAWLSKKESKIYRLPSEAEWEYACRAGTTTRYASGDNPETLACVGNVPDAAFKVKFPAVKWVIKASDGYIYTAPVGRFKPNAFGLYDMHGNANQRCADGYATTYYAISPVDDPTGPDSRAGRVFRGGSWSYSPNRARSADRNWAPADERDNGTGFRVAVTP
jgi:formylglycine-generating enzyme required for sulfatase activity